MKGQSDHDLLLSLKSGLLQMASIKTLTRKLNRDQMRLLTTYLLPNLQEETIHNFTKAEMAEILWDWVSNISNI